MKFITLNLFEEDYGGLRYVGKISIVPSQICSLKKSNLLLSDNFKRKVLLNNLDNLKLRESDLDFSEISLADGLGKLLVAESESYILNLLS